ncbi:MAG: FAD-dependent oxidoreductase [Clostridia bacterium]|nr:FAD-dependent oxidoreductase [Clostridia bacterium]
MKRILIVGGVAGGATAAARIRRLDERAEIVIFERSGYISYANCGLPYYIGGVIEDGDDLTLQTPEGFARRFRIDARVHHEVVDIDPVAKQVTVCDLKSGHRYQERYDVLLLSPGAKPVLPDYKGLPDRRAFTLRTVEDAFAIRGFVEAEKPRTALVIGGGFIGLEMAENLAEAGLFVTLIQRGEHLLNVIDADMASFVHAKLKGKGVRLLLSANVTDVQGEADGVTAILDCGQRYSADMVILAIGVTPENELARKIGLRLGQKGAIAVNERMQTSLPDIYAVGDAVEVTHGVTGMPAVISLAGPANKQGRVAADNICGIDSTYRASFGSSVIKIFDMTVATTGITEMAALRAGLDFEKVILTPASHAGYYPDASAMTLKVLYERRTRRLLGAQIVGYDGVDKRIDVLATAMQAGLAADRLCTLDLAYAPPYSSAKDPVNMAGFIIENIEKGLVKQFYYEDIAQLRARDDVTLLDTRTDGEYARGHAEGFCHIPLDSLRDRLGELDKEKPVYVMCQSGLRSYLATRILSQNGFDAYNFAGGYRLYQSITTDRAAARFTAPCGAEQ